MDFEDNAYIPKYHPDNYRLIQQAVRSLTGLLLITLLAVGVIWYTSPNQSTSTILGTQTP